MSKDTGKPKTRERAKSKPKPTRAEIVAAAAQWVTNVRDLINALADSIDEARKQARDPESPFHGLLDTDDLLSMQNDLNNALCCSVLLNGSTVHHIPTPLELMQKEGV